MRGATDVVEAGVGAAAVEPPALERVRLRAHRRVLWMRLLWASADDPGAQGLAISHADVDRILADPGPLGAAEARFYATDATTRRLGELIADADRRAAGEPRWRRVREAFGLADHEVDFLSLAVAADVEPFFRRVYGYLNDDATLGAATPWLAAALFQWPSGVGIGPASPVGRWRLARPADGGANSWSAGVAWSADPALVAWLVHGTIAEPALAGAVEIVPPAAAPAACLYPAELAALRAFVDALGGPAPPTAIELELVGPVGAGKRTVAAQLAAALGVPLLAADAAGLVGADVSAAVAAERITALTRLARLAGALVYWDDVEVVPPPLWPAAATAAPVTVFGARASRSSPAGHGVARRSVTLPALTRADRVVLWRRLSDAPVPAPVSEWTLRPADIVAAARVAPAGAEAVLDACRGQVARDAADVLERVACPYGWDDIVLAPPLLAHLAELEAQAHLRGPVYEEWGFGRLCPVGRGITAMFAGPSGTGKTMAAQVLARSLGLPLYRVDLAGVVNKYIGETEKRLKRVFEACERTNVVLFFDEADALFGRRTQVKDAHDRFANIEIDYLLQRMEQFDGIAILATNRRGDLDEAFLRRLRFVIEFTPPGPRERRALWRRVLAAATPAGEPLLDGIDWDWLADKLAMTGADITATGLGAAFAARAAGTRITMRHVVHAARREMAKHGVIMRGEAFDGVQT